MLKNKRPTYRWLNRETLRFGFDEVISLENVQKLQQLERFIVSRLGGQVVESVAGYHTLTVFLRTASRVDVVDLLDEWELQQYETVQLAKRYLRIPVCYDIEFALDLERVAKETCLSAAEVIQLHSERTYTVFMMGFLPGFPYLGGLDERLIMPRLAVPRKNVVAGSVGIGGAQTGIYPIDSPGGWNILGRTPLQLFDVAREQPFLFTPNDVVQFVAIDKVTFTALRRDGVSEWCLY